MTLKLYHSPYSTCSQKVRLVLHEKELAFESCELNFRKEEQLSDHYLKINPNGVVPTLVHDGAPVVDSSCIIEYLDEVFPALPLAPATPLGRALLRAWLRFIEEVPTAAVRVPSFEQVFLPSLRIVQSPGRFERSAAKRTIRRGFYEKMHGGAGFSQEDIDNSTRQLRETFRRMDEALADGPWVLGESITLVDFALAPLIDRLDDLAMDFLFSEHPQVQSWLERIRARPCFDLAFYKGSRLSQRLEFKYAFSRVGVKRMLNRRSAIPGQSTDRSVSHETSASRS